jgi:hypothetical protein
MEASDGSTGSASTLPHVGWLEGAANTWGVPVVDARPVTFGMLSTSKDPQSAANAVSFRGEDGVRFAKLTTDRSRTVQSHLCFPVRAGLCPGVLFVPAVMEEKWAIFYHDGRILFVRSWTRSLLASAAVRLTEGIARIGPIHGYFARADESERFTVRALEYLLRSHALDEIYPAPLPEQPDDLRTAALWCFHMFGRRAPLATASDLPTTTPIRPLYRRSIGHSCREIARCWLGSWTTAVMSMFDRTRERPR